MRPSGYHISTPCVHTIDFSRGARKCMARTTGARLGCPATTNFVFDFPPPDRLRAARIAVARNLPFARSLPVKIISRPATLSLFNSGPSFKLKIRHSIPRLAANSVITEARCLPARCTPPAASSSGKSPISTRRVCLVPGSLASSSDLLLHSTHRRFSVATTSFWNDNLTPEKSSHA